MDSAAREQKFCSTNAQLTNLVSFLGTSPKNTFAKMLLGLKRHSCVLYQLLSVDKYSTDYCLRSYLESITKGYSETEIAS